MATNEKEINGYLFDQLTQAERLERAYKKGEFEEELKLVKKEITRKLYQEPPLTSE